MWNVVRVCRDATRRSKAHLELNLARDEKDKKKGFFKYISIQEKTKEKVDGGRRRIQRRRSYSVPSLPQYFLRHPSPWR